MSDKINVLIIDDDRFVQKLISKTLSASGLSTRAADDGESGIAIAQQGQPDLILLDVEMPGINGYEVCDRLRSLPETQDIPVVFLSSHGTLRERLQGYEVGADDYLVKPFEAEHLLARINVLMRYGAERKELSQRYQQAQQTAIIAITGTSELAQAMHFLEKSLSYSNFDEIAQGLFNTTTRFSLECVLLISANDELHWFSSQGSISPLEKELIEMNDKESRFFDFGARTIINFPQASLLVKNMPLEDMDRYGRLKDLFPILLSAVNTKINVLATQAALTQQNHELLRSFSQIRGSLYHLAKTILVNRDHSNKLLQDLVHDISYDMMRMGLEEDQEEYLLHRIDSAIEEAMQQMDAGQEISEVFYTINHNLKSVISNQESLVQAFISSQASESTEQSEDDSDIELF
ncbi:response regulator [endosymbiont of Ridgeia piscesae]|jgi:CheY-like chemotaxis protein/gluconate kinase|uniref:Response regulator receiver domain n=1 Tax=endosymbiont of Ridgeia piscesae TaxID=54398 RepID=A0A0T5YWY1_9GAMM|nr:response regulator [endosymbiont of Ridgeia piscesae]KRT55052.1 Response regulator receiver domain [endosymbiont of Ridgeia piscesae]KRT57081.1 Response regulator receiver domain-containing protein [endosymbiont of Ridgeia piscesae]